MLNNLINKINSKMKRWFVARSDTHALVYFKTQKYLKTEEGGRGGSVFKNIIYWSGWMRVVAFDANSKFCFKSFILFICQ